MGFLAKTELGIGNQNVITCDNGLPSWFMFWEKISTPRRLSGQLGEPKAKKQNSFHVLFGARLALAFFKADLSKVEAITAKDTDRRAIISSSRPNKWKPSRRETTRA